MIDRGWHAHQVEAFTRERDAFRAYAAFLAEVLGKAAESLAPGAIIQTRAKTISSFAEKAVRKAAKYKNPVHELTDLCGARVIALTLDEVEALCGFIRANFEIDVANSEDKQKLLRSSEFGYLSVHFVVQAMKPVLGIRPPHSIGNRKAEIQVRTLVQHAWAGLAHDLLYKLEFKPPRAWERQFNRLAAVLEGTDREFNDLVDTVRTYTLNYGVFLTLDERRDEAEALTFLLASEPDLDQRRQIALRLARLAHTSRDWDLILQQLKEKDLEQDAGVKRELGNALCSKWRKDPNSTEFRKGLGLLERVIVENPSDAEAHACLAAAYEQLGSTVEMGRARREYAAALEHDPRNPHYLAGFLEHEVASGECGSMSLLAPSLRSAIERCRAYADLKVEVPWVLFDMGKFQLLLGEPYEALDAFARGVFVCLDEKAAIHEDVLREQIQCLDRLSPEVRQAGSDWSRRLLLAALSVESGKAHRELTDLAVHRSSPSHPTLIVAGAGSALSPFWNERYIEWLSKALEPLSGDVISGGNAEGISGVVAEAVAILKAGGRKEFSAIGYLPQSASLDSRYDEAVKTAGNTFSAAEPIQAWIDLIAAGVHPEDVQVLGIGGGSIAAAEYAIALSLGATVGVVAESGRAADAILADPFWSSTGRLLRLVPDAMTLRAFVVGPALRKRSQLSQKALDDAAQAVHERYCSDTRKARQLAMADLNKLQTVALLTWQELPNDFQNSNREQVLFAEEALRLGGFGVRPVDAEADVLEFVGRDRDAIELMAAFEHGRWNVERARSGWRPGPKDLAKKLTPYLLPWDQLPEDIKDYDRKAVREWPAILSAARLDLYRL